MNVCGRSFLRIAKILKPNNGVDFSFLFWAVEKAYAVATGVSGKEAVSTIEGDFAVYV